VTGRNLGTGRGAVRHAVLVGLSQLAHVLLGTPEIHLAEHVGMHRLGPVLPATKRAIGRVDRPSAMVARHECRRAVEAALLPFEYDAVAFSVKVVRSLIGSQVGHEKKSMVLEIHLAPVG
jgi:hypothetical protein